MNGADLALFLVVGGLALYVAAAAVRDLVRNARERRADRERGL